MQLDFLKRIGFLLHSNEFHHVEEEYILLYLGDGFLYNLIIQSDRNNNCIIYSFYTGEKRMKFTHGFIVILILSMMGTGTILFTGAATFTGGTLTGSLGGNPRPPGQARHDRGQPPARVKPG